MGKKLSNGNKTTNPNMDMQPLSKSYTWHDFMDPEASLLYPSKYQDIERLIYTFCLWSEAEKSYDITQFCMEYKIPRKSFYLLIDKHPKLKNTIEQIKIFLGCRKRIGALEKNLDKEVVFKDMHKYDPEWIEINKYHADLKKEEGSGLLGKIGVELAPIEITQEVSNQLKKRVNENRDTDKTE